jgi:hypothetical protein
VDETGQEMWRDGLEPVGDLPLRASLGRVLKPDVSLDTDEAGEHCGSRSQERVGPADPARRRVRRATTAMASAKSTTRLETGCGQA